MSNQGSPLSALSRRGFLQTVAGVGIVTALSLGSDVARGCPHGERVPDRESPLTERWRFDGADTEFGPATVRDGVVYAASGPSVYAIDSEDGTELWQFESGETEVYDTYPVIVAGEVAYAALDRLYALDASDGSEKWRFDPEEPVSSGTTLAVTSDGPTVFVGGEGATLYALDARDGSTRWRYEVEDEIDHTPVVDDGTVYVGGDGFHAVSIDDGSEQWRFNDISYPEASPTVALGTVYAGSQGGTLYALDTEDGTERWNYEVEGEIEETPTVRDGTVYLSEHNGSLCAIYREIYALDAEDGTEQWVVDTGMKNNTAPTLVDDTLLSASLDYVLGIDSESGTIRWGHELQEAESAADVVAGAVYVAAEDSLVALDSEFDGSSAGSRALYASNGHQDEWRYTGYELGVDGLVASDEASERPALLEPDAPSGTETPSPEPPRTTDQPTESGMETADEATAGRANGSASTTTTGGDGPGFGVVGALAGLGGAGYLFRQRTDNE